MGILELQGSSSKIYSDNIYLDTFNLNVVECRSTSECLMENESSERQKRFKYDNIDKLHSDINDGLKFKHEESKNVDLNKFYQHGVEILENNEVSGSHKEEANSDYAILNQLETCKTFEDEERTQLNDPKKKNEKKSKMNSVSDLKVITNTTSEIHGESEMIRIKNTDLKENKNEVEDKHSSRKRRNEIDINNNEKSSDHITKRYDDLKHKVKKSAMRSPSRNNSKSYHDKHSTERSRKSKRHSQKSSRGNDYKETYERRRKRNKINKKDHSSRKRMRFTRIYGSDLRSSRCRYHSSRSPVSSSFSCSSNEIPSRSVSSSILSSNSHFRDKTESRTHKYKKIRSLTSNIHISGTGPERLGGVLAPKTKDVINEDSSSNRCKILSIDELQKKYIDDEIKRRLDEEIEKQFKAIIESDEFRTKLQQKIDEEKTRLQGEMRLEIEYEKKKIVEEMKKKEEEEKKSKQLLEDILAENEKRIKEEQKRIAEEQAKVDEERLKELRQIQMNREEERRKKLLEERESEKKNSVLQNRQKLTFKMKSLGSASLF